MSAPNQVKSVKTERLRRLGVICSAGVSRRVEVSFLICFVCFLSKISLWLPKFGHQIRESSFLDARSMLLSQNHNLRLLKWMIPCEIYWQSLVVEQINGLEQ